MNDLLQRKKELRESLIAARDAIPAQVRASRDEAIIARFTRLVTYRYSKLLLLYSPIGSEIDVLPLEKAALRDGKKVAYPRCGEDRTMKFYIVPSHEALEPGFHGIMEPPQGFPEADISDASGAAVIIPALSWDMTGHRIGYGGGYYDRWLPGFAGAKVGFCYSDNLSRELPRGRFDAGCGIIVTEKGVRAFNG